MEAFFYDAWEEGFAGAAATAIQTTPGVMPGYNPIDPGPFYASSVYEPQNQPDLGGTNSNCYTGTAGGVRCTGGFNGHVFYDTRVMEQDFPWIKPKAQTSAAKKKPVINETEKQPSGVV